MRNLLLSTSVLALVLGLGMASASATDKPETKPTPNDPVVNYPKNDKVVTEVREVHKFSNTVTNDWSWVKDVNETVDIKIDIEDNIPNITDLVQIGNVQKLFGSVDATTTINASVGKGGGTTSTVEKVEAVTGGWGKPDTKTTTTTTTTAATTLPVVLGSATALGNMFSLSSSEPTLLLNSDQIHKAAKDSGAGVSVDATATADVSGAAVKLDATAISNMLSINLSEPTVVIGSIMQTSYADVSSTATLDQSIDSGYNLSFAGLTPENIEGGALVNPADMTGVVASVTSTAIGNMASINLGTYASIPTGAGSNFGK